MHILSTTSDRQKSAIKENLAVAYPVYVNKEGLLKRKTCSKVKFLKDFQSFDILSFEKSVEEMMLRVMAFTFDDLDLC